MKKTTKLKQLLVSPELSFLMEAHNGLSAKIVEEAGFQGIWGSGLSMSASLGVRDSNEASWTQVVDVMEYMCDATSIPILLDGDTGYGNFNNMRRLVKKLEQRGVAGVCIEDKLFPKTNSFIGGEKQELADTDEFSMKISAAKDTQSDSDFVVVARTEAFIAGWGLKEALKRAEAYRRAGADAILVHSKLGNVSEIESFMKEWGNRLPIVIVPTKYYSTPTEKFRQMGISTAIWANHNLRASINAMKEVSAQIFKGQTLLEVEDKVARLDEVFRLQGAEELAQAEDKYLPTAGKKTNAIILAAAQGNLGELTQEVPKTLVKMNGKPILETLLTNLRATGIKDINVVRGFKKEAINYPGLKCFDNNEHATTNAVYSLFLAKEELKEDTLVVYGDIVFKRYVLSEVLDSHADAVLVADPEVDAQLVKQSGNKDKKELIGCSSPYDWKQFDQDIRLVHTTMDPQKAKIDGEFIGVMRLKGEAVERAKSLLQAYFEQDRLKTVPFTEFLDDLNRKVPFKVHFIRDSWINVNSIKDLQ